MPISNDDDDEDDERNTLEILWNASADELYISLAGCPERHDGLLASKAPLVHASWQPTNKIIGV